MLGKLGAVLNKDVGALVKDAGKVLNTDVGDIVKGAGKVLNTDLGELLRGTTEETKTDAPAAAPASAPAAPAEKAPVAAERPKPAAEPPAFDPTATTRLYARIPTPPEELSPAPAPRENISQAKLTDGLVTRSALTMPRGTSLAVLLPPVLGDFERPPNVPAGELTADPVAAVYISGGGEKINVKLVQCWDASEASEQLDEVLAQAGGNSRMAADKSWVLGQTAQGIVFAWTRDSYSFSAAAPQGMAALAKFLGAFPY